MYKDLPSLKHSFLENKEISQINIQGVRYLLSLKFDFDVYLPTKGINLQRGLVWTLRQKQSLIESIIIRRQIPPVSVIYNDEDVYEIIDGKQRINTILDYLNLLFRYCGYLYKELPEQYYSQFNRNFLIFNKLLPEWGVPISDEEKIEWFCFINFAGTPQDLKHFAKLTSKTQKENEESIGVTV